MAPWRPGPLNRLFCENPLSGSFLLNRGPNFKIHERGRSWARAGARWARAPAGLFQVVADPCRCSAHRRCCSFRPHRFTTHRRAILGRRRPLPLLHSSSLLLLPATPLLFPATPLLLPASYSASSGSYSSYLLL
jgi:hypothetical protein